MAKPTLYTPEVAKTILERIANGEPLNWICRDEGMPNPRTVRDWKKQKPEFEEAYGDARADSADCGDTHRKAGDIR